MKVSKFAEILSKHVERDRSQLKVFSSSYPEVFSFPGLLILTEVTHAAKLANVESAVDPVKVLIILSTFSSFYTAVVSFAAVIRVVTQRFSPTS